MIDFVRPWLLVGIFGALVPVAIHLLGRRNAPTVRFTALHFLLTRFPERARAARLRERLLLALRMLIAALIAVALAKPLVPSFALQAEVVAGDAPVALVIVLDDSLSMATRSNGGPTRLAQARARARALLGQLPMGSAAAVVAAGFPARALQTQLSTELTDVGRALAGVQESARSDNAERALALARQLLVGSAQADRRIVVLSDLQRDAWAELAPVDAGGAGPRLMAERFAGGPVRNVAVVGAKAEPAPDRGPQHVRVVVELRNDGAQPFAGHVTVHAGDRELKRWVELAAKGTGRRTFVLPTVVDTALVSLPDDDLAADNARHVILSGRDGLRVGLIDGSPRPVPRDDEVFFAARALQAGAERAGSIAVDVLAVSGVDAALLGRYDVAVLANVAELPAATVDALMVRLREGMGVLITAGDSAREAGAQWLRGVLPWQPAGVRELGATERQRGLQVNADRAPRATHSLRDTLVELALPTLLTAPTYKHLLVVPDGVAAGEDVARFGNGAPALLVRTVGRGRIGLWTTTIDRDWTDIPLQPGFMPLMVALTEHLSGHTPGAARGLAEPGRATPLARHKNAMTLEIRRDRDDGELVQRMQADKDDPLRWHVKAPTTTGAYRLIERGGGAVWSTRALAVVPPQSELAGAPSDDPARWQPPQAQQHSADRARVPGWPLAFGALLLLLLMEAAVVWRAHSPTRVRS